MLLVGASAAVAQPVVRKPAMPPAPPGKTTVIEVSKQASATPAVPRHSFVIPEEKVAIPPAPLGGFIACVEQPCCPDACCPMRRQRGILPHLNSLRAESCDEQPCGECCTPRSKEDHFRHFVRWLCYHPTHRCTPFCGCKQANPCCTPPLYTFFPCSGDSCSTYRPGENCWVEESCCTRRVRSK
jgi:hypothetical protein